MTGTRKAQQQAKESAWQAQAAQAALAQQEQEAQRRKERETMRAQRLLMRSMRAAGGGIFETDATQTLGGSGALG